MTTLVTPTKLQKVEYDVTTQEGPSRVTIVTGQLPVPITVASLSGAVIVQRESFKALLDPTLAAGQFRRTTATASMGSLSQVVAGTGPNGWAIEDAQATFDDEAGQVQLVIDVALQTNGSRVSAHSILFQVTTLARV